MRVLLLDARMELADAVFDTFGSTHSLYDYDLVLWDPLASVMSYNGRHEWHNSRTHQGRRWLSSSDSANIQRAVARRSKELVEFLKLGRTLVVFLSGDLRVEVETGEFRYSGTGKNRQTTTVLKTFDILEVLPIELRREFATGVELEPVDSSIGPLYRDTSNYWMYGSLIESDQPLHPLFRVTGTTKVVAAEASYESSRIIFLPGLRTHEDEDEDDEFEEDGDDDADPDEAVEPGEPTEPPSANPDDIVDRLVYDWLVTRISTEDMVWPDWSTEYRFQSEVDRTPKIEALGQQIEELQTTLDGLTQEQDTDLRWKMLVAGTGTPFEFAVADAMQVLGFDLESVVPGRSDIRATLNDRHAVVETKGVTKSAAESHCAQLEKWVAEEMVQERVAKGILVINAFLKLPPLKRTQPAFPDQMRKYAEQRNHCLITGLQLLNLARTALADPRRRDELSELLLDTTGVLEGWDDATAVFTEVPTDHLPQAPKKRATPRKRSTSP